jgi:hypothetical protein
MILRKLITTDYKQFPGRYEWEFDKVTIVKGDNGAGKTNMSVDAPLFALTGYSIANMDGIPTQGKKSCSVQVIIEHKGKTYDITRSVPTNLSVKIDGAEIDSIGTAGKQEYLNKIFGNTDYIRRFRLITNSRKYNKTQETNFLEEGKTTLNKILLSLNQTNFNGIRQRLLQKKSERENYQISNLGKNLHYPSEKRLQVLIASYEEANNSYKEIMADLSPSRSEYATMCGQQGGLRAERDTLTKQIHNLKTYPNCYACKQPLPQEQRQNSIIEKEAELKKIEEAFTKLAEEMNIQQSMVKSLESTAQETLTMRDKIGSYRDKIQASIASRKNQTKFIYTEKDVLIIKKAIDELDKFYSYYLKQSIEVLAPIINSVIGKLGLAIEFITDTKGNFDLVLHQGNQTFAYDFMSDGQRLIINSAFKIALLLERGEDGWIVADEGFSSLTEENLRHIFTLFSNLPFQLVCVLHRYDNVPESVRIIDLSPKEGKSAPNIENSQPTGSSVKSEGENETIPAIKRGRGRPKKDI